MKLPFMNLLCDIDGHKVVVDEDKWEELRQGHGFYAIGYICDSNRFQDNCSTDCRHYAQGTCPCTIHRDENGNLWHVLPLRQYDY